MKFTINGTEYEGAKYDFNTHCDFDAMGVNVLSIRKNPLPVIRAYLAISTGMDLHEAGKELEKHLIDGGSYTDIISCLAKEMNDSDFFMAMIKENQEPKEKTKREKATKADESNTDH